MKGKRKKSLAAIVAFYTALVLAATMAVYAVLQYFAEPDQTVKGLVIEHTMHVVLIGGFTYLVLYGVLHRKVVQPVRVLYMKLYKIARGDFNPIDEVSDVMEIQEIIDGINMMVSRMNQSTSEEFLIELSHHVGDLRSFAGGSAGLDETARDELRSIATKIETTVAAMTAQSI